jgi:hypothetical protein
MTGEKQKEFARRLWAEGFVTNFDERGAGYVGNGAYTVSVTEDGEIRCKPEARDFARRVHGIRGEVEEYMTAFKSSVYGNGEFPGADTDIETRTLLKHAACELAMRLRRDGRADFVTWRLDRNGGRELGHYCNSYAEAKEDFAVRAGLIDRNRLFTETELTVIRSGLSEYLSLGSESPDGRREDTIESVIDKIDDVIAPEIEERERIAAERDFGREPEP